MTSSYFLLVSSSCRSVVIIMAFACSYCQIPEPPDDKPLVPRILTGAKVPLAGYPSLYFLPLHHPVECKAVAVNVFGYKSRKESLIISIDNDHNSSTVLASSPLLAANDEDQPSLPADHPDVVAAVAQHLGQVCYIKYPHLVPALITAVVTENARYRCASKLVDKRNCRCVCVLCFRYRCYS